MVQFIRLTLCPLKIVLVKKHLKIAQIISIHYKLSNMILITLKIEQARYVINRKYYLVKFKIK
jgi:hypothetical protein